jgi:hypothetical protein
MSAALTKGRVSGTSGLGSKNFPVSDQLISVDSGSSIHSIVAIASSILQDAVKGFAAQEMPPAPEFFGTRLLGLESIANELRQEASKLLDAAARLQRQPSEDFAQMASGHTDAGSISDGEGQDVIVLKSPSPVRAGESGCVDLSVENDDPIETISCSLFSTDLVGSLGHSISKTQIRISPSTVRVPPGTSVDARIEIRVPLGTPRGGYAGLLQAVDGGLQRFVLQILVT